MPSRTPAPRSHARVWLTIPNELFRWTARRVETGDRAATLDRFFHSRHVMDLRAVVIIALGAVLLVLVFGLALSLENAWEKVHATDKETTINPYVQLISTTLANFLTFFAPVLAAFGAVVAWAYQAGSARLGVVDLFACEISTLCRVTAVLDTVAALIKRIGDAPPQDAGVAAPAHAPQAESGGGFASQEDYFTVFQNNTKDLQSLEARVVINITAFYTYMKAVRDSMRALAQLRAGADEGLAAARRTAGRDLIYLLYLGLESARRAIDDLVEFEPEQAERTITILISELAAYRFLRSEFGDAEDIRHGRLQLREPEYRDLVRDLVSLVEAGKHGPYAARWERAWVSLPELRRRYAAMLAATHPLAPAGPGEHPPAAADAAQRVTA